MGFLLPQNKGRDRQYTALGSLYYSELPAAVLPHGKVTSPPKMAAALPAPCPLSRQQAGSRKESKWTLF